MEAVLRKRRQKKIMKLKPTPRRLRPAAAARYLHIGESTLNSFRTSGGGPRFIKLAGRIFYDVHDLDAWIEANKFTSTADYATT